jgi:hypothetical protein
MNSLGFGASSLLATAARPAMLGGRVRETLCYLVPPLLLPRRPNLRDATSCAREWFVPVVAALNEARDTVAIVRGERCNVHGHCPDHGALGATTTLTTLLTADHAILRTSAHRRIAA